MKQLYRSNPDQALVTLEVRAVVDIATLTCRFERPPGDAANVIAGLHPAAGGDGASACSGDLLLQSLASCAGVTLAAVATSMGVELQQAEIIAVGHMDFRGTLAVQRDVPVGLTSIELTFRLISSAGDEQLDKLLQLVERYCVVMQTLQHSVPIVSRRS